MAFIKVEDMESSIECIVFPKTLNKCNELIEEDNLVVIKGRISIREDEETKILCESVEPLYKINKDKIYVLVEDNKEMKKTVEEFKSQLTEYVGNTPIYICTNSDRKKYLIDRNLWVDGEIEVLTYLREKFGEENVKILR